MEILLRWVDHNQNTISAVVERKEKDAEDSTYETVAALTNGETQYKDTGLTEETEYSYRVILSEGKKSVPSTIDLKTSASKVNFLRGGRYDGHVSFSLDKCEITNGSTSFILNKFTAYDVNGTVGNGDANAIQMDLREEMLHSTKVTTVVQFLWFAPTIVENATIGYPLSGFSLYPGMAGLESDSLQIKKGIAKSLVLGTSGPPRTPAEGVIAYLHYPSDRPSSPTSPTLSSHGTEDAPYEIEITAPTLTMVEYEDDFSAPSDSPDNYLIEASDDNGNTWYKLGLIPAHDVQGNYLSSLSYELPSGIPGNVRLRIHSSNLTGYSETALEFNLGDL